MVNDKGNNSAQKELSKEYKKLLSKRDNLVSAIMSQEERVKKGNVSRAMAATRVEVIQNSFKKYESVMEKIFDHDEYDPDHFVIKNTQLMESYQDAVAAFKEIIDDGKDESMSLSSTMSNRTNESAHAIKLPKISLPTLDGKQLKWTTFYDTFSSLVDQNPNMAKINKMHYLRDSLSGEAFRTISKIPASDANYDIAWQVLQDK